MPTERTVPPGHVELRNGVLVLFGYGIDVRVWRGHLRVEDGIGYERREGLLHRATSGLKRLVIIGHTGTITLDAIRWLAGVGASLVHIGADGEVLAATHPAAYEQPRLRCAQALALDTPVGL